MFPSKQEILRSNGTTGDNLSKWESPIQNERVGMYEAFFKKKVSKENKKAEYYLKSLIFLIKPLCSNSNEKKNIQAHVNIQK